MTCDDSGVCKDASGEAADKTVLLDASFSVAAAASDGSYGKALNLLRSNSVRIYVRRLDKSVEATVCSERGNDLYHVSAGTRRSDGKVFAKCDCMDYRRRGGVCKHGAAVLLTMQQEGGTPTSQLEPAAALDGHSLATPVKKRKAEAVCTSQFRSAAAEAADLASAKLPKIAAPVFPKSGAASERREGFTTGEAVAAAAASKRTGASRRDALKAALSTKMLTSQAASGDAAGFVAELKRRGAAPLEDAAYLLRKAILCDSRAGGDAVALAILERPEGAAAAAAPESFKAREGDDGHGATTLLHLTVFMERLEVCRSLLRRGARKELLDWKGRTAMDFARSRKMDAAALRQGQQTDPFVALLSS
eukprot:TRINITY_DN48919_c0_g1_i1.p1 TRINITY_DN48919_c0_g1~~TRINITY_DN48919_c0_g1_i1.p1  ORF type:complete len:363 (+),score=106.60 TRINITY_DN48919_c0_g1_i1:53-1141(+)